jgi:hypothetical protein
MLVFLTQTSWPAAVVLIAMILALVILFCFFRASYEEEKRQARRDYLEHKTKPGTVVDVKSAPRLNSDA